MGAKPKQMGAKKGAPKMIHIAYQDNFVFVSMVFGFLNHMCLKGLKEDFVFYKETFGLVCIKRNLILMTFL